jgi:hypothetical protein
VCNRFVLDLPAHKDQQDQNSHCTVVSILCASAAIFGFNAGHTASHQVQGSMISVCAVVRSFERGLTHLPPGDCGNNCDGFEAAKLIT